MPSAIPWGRDKETISITLRSTQFLTKPASDSDKWQLASQTSSRASPVKKILLILILCLLPSAKAIDYVKCEAIQRAAERLKSAMDAEAQAAQNAIVLPALKKAQAICSTNYVNNEALNCMSIRMANYEAEGVIARDEVIEKYAPSVDRVLAEYEAMGCY